MATTRAGPETAEDYLARLTPEGRRSEALRLDAIFRAASGFRPHLWGGRMLGYGRYAYRYGSGHAGESLATGSAASKAEISIYILSGPEGFGGILARLGPYRLGKACLYLKRLEGIDETALADLIRAGLADLATRWTILPD